jgi:Zn-dependent protease
MDVGIMQTVLVLFVVVNLLLMIFNLIPIPPLDGSKVLYAFLSPETAWRVRPVLEQYGTYIFLIAVFFPIFGGRTLFSVIIDILLPPLVGLLVGI